MSSFVLIAVILSAATITVAICHRASSIGEWLRVIDYPDVTGGRKRHNNPTPLIGGFAILCALLATAPLTVWLNHAVQSQVEDLVAMASLVAVFAFTGFVDDREELSPKIRLFIMLVATGFAIHNQPALTVQFLYFDFFGKALLLGNWGIVFTLIALVGLANAVNMADGKNGLVLGMCLIWNVVLLFHSAAVLTPILLISLAVTGVAFVYNMRGALFLGDTGSFGLACFYGLVAIYSYTQNFVRLPADVIVLLFMVPVLDCLRLMVSRVVRGASPFSAGRDHLHHHVAAAMGWNKGLFVYLALVAVPLAMRFAFHEWAPLALILQFSAFCFTLSACAFRTRVSTGDVAA